MSESSVLGLRARGLARNGRASGRHRAGRRRRRRSPRAPPAARERAGNRDRRRGGRRRIGRRGGGAPHGRRRSSSTSTGPGTSRRSTRIRAVEQASPGTRVIVLLTKDDARFVRHALPCRCGRLHPRWPARRGSHRRRPSRGHAGDRAGAARRPDRHLTTSPSASSTYCDSSPWATRTPRSPHSCISRSARSRRTAPICSRSWAARAAPSSCATRSIAACCMGPRTQRRASGTLTPTG